MSSSYASFFATTRTVYVPFSDDTMKSAPYVTMFAISLVDTWLFEASLPSWITTASNNSFFSARSMIFSSTVCSVVTP